MKFMLYFFGDSFLTNKLQKYKVFFQLISEKIYNYQILRRVSLFFHSVLGWSTNFDCNCYYKHYYYMSQLIWKTPLDEYLLDQTSTNLKIKGVTLVKGKHLSKSGKNEKLNIQKSVAIVVVGFSVYIKNVKLLSSFTDKDSILVEILNSR